MIGIDYVAPSDVARAWRAGTTSPQHARGCPCLCCADRRLDVLFLNAAFDCRAAQVPAALVVPTMGIGPAWLFAEGE